MSISTNDTIGVIGLGYVGLPLAVSFAKKFKVIGFDTSHEKVGMLKEGIDPTAEVDSPDLHILKKISFTTNGSDLSNCKYIIVCVPTPVTKGNVPDITYLQKSSEQVAELVKNSNSPKYLCYESTVYPGCTEEACIPIIEKLSGKKLSQDFYVGYSPERINPGDKEHKFETICKVVSGCCEHSLNAFENMYSQVVKAKLHKASSIKVAEAAKVIENTQRDINIALINELSIIFEKLDIPTKDVIEAASTKWNFLPFTPGLVGGHCIGVDPYYLSYKAICEGYIPEIINAGRKLNDSYSGFITSTVVREALKRPAKSSDKYSALVVGVAFKENVPDVRNSKVFDVIQNLNKYGFKVDVCDPEVSTEECVHEYGINVNSALPSDFNPYDVVIISTPHNTIKEDITRKVSNLKDSTIADLKWMFDKQTVSELSQKNTVWQI